MIEQYSPSDRQKKNIRRVGRGFGVYSRTAFADPADCGTEEAAVAAYGGDHVL
jgi:hypothetical protein